MSQTYIKKCCLFFYVVVVVVKGYELLKGPRRIF